MDAARGKLGGTGGLCATMSVTAVPGVFILMWDRCGASYRYGFMDHMSAR